MSLPALAEEPDLREHLARSAIAGDVATPREENLPAAGRMAARMPGYDFGITPRRRWS